MSLNFKVDFKDFIKGTEIMTLEMEQVCKRALTHTGYRIVFDTVTEIPKPPLKWGNLRGSFSVTVTKQNPITDIPGVGSQKRTAKSKAGKTLKEPRVEILKPEISNMDKLELRVGFNVPYARKMHEELKPAGQLNPRFPDESENAKIESKFLEKKLTMFGDRYFKLLQFKIGEGMAKL